jgi:hypothetical protein
MALFSCLASALDAGAGGDTNRERRVVLAKVIMNCIVRHTGRKALEK